MSDTRPVQNTRRDAVTHSWLLRVELAHPHLAPPRQWAMAKRLEQDHRPPPARCRHGHRYTPENTYVLPNGERRCRTCQRRHGARQSAERYPSHGGYPIAPLLEAVARRYSLPSAGCRPLAEACGVPRETALSWLLARRLTIYDADRAAIALGVHPSAIWTDWFERAQESA